MSEKVNLLGGSELLSKPEIPFDLVKLPSRGLVYNENHPLHNEEDVAFREMSTQEENILASVALLKKGTVINTLLKSCLINKSIDPTELLIGDKSAITLMIRISGFGAEYKVKTRCPSCSNDFPHEFDLSKCQYKFLEVEPVKKGENVFDFVLPKSKKKVFFSLLTDREDNDVMRSQTNRKKSIHGNEVDTIITDRLKVQIKEIQGVDARNLADYIDTMPIRDSRALRNYINKISPDMIMEEKVSCNFCGSEEVHTIPLGMDFFWPKME